MAMFDPETFMNQIIDEPLETEFVTVDPGEYVATIDDFTSEAFEQIHFEYKKGARAGTPGIMTKLTLPFVIQDDAVKQLLEMEKVVVRKQLILDLQDNGDLDWGTNKNIDLGRIRAAVGQNDPGPWSISKLRGAGPVMVKVTKVPFERKDGSKGERTEIERVVRIA
jgi:hypothetical protein